MAASKNTATCAGCSKKETPSLSTLTLPFGWTIVAMESAYASTRKTFCPDCFALESAPLVLTGLHAEFQANERAHYVQTRGHQPAGSIVKNLPPPPHLR